MLEFKVIENLKPNKDSIDILKKVKYKLTYGQFFKMSKFDKYYYPPITLLKTY